MKWLKIRNPNINEKHVSQDLTDVQNSFRTSLGIENWYRNHFTTDEQQEFSEDLFDIDLPIPLKIL